MKRLMLLRHAKAVAAEAPLADIARPLAERGEKDARRVGERLQRHAVIPTAILASSAARTARTAQIVADCLDYPRRDLVLDARLYLAEPATILDVIGDVDEAHDVLLVVGHNPGLTELVHRLLPGFDVDDLPTGAVVALDYAVARGWSEVGSAEARLGYYDYPKNAGEPLIVR